MMYIIWNTPFDADLNTGRNEGRSSDLKISSYSNRVGGFASVNAGVIRDCYTDTKLKFDCNAAGFVFENNGKTERTIAFGTIKGKENVGGYLCKNMGTVTDGVWLHPKGKNLPKNVADADFMFEYEKMMEVFEALHLGVAWKEPKGDDKRLELRNFKANFDERTEGKTVIEISTADALFRLAADIANGDKNAAAGCYRLTANINLKGKKWLPIGISETVPFTGVFDGAGYKILNFKVCSDKLDYAGFFGYTRGASIGNLTLDCVVNAKGGSVTGALCAVNDRGLISNCRVVAKVSAEKSCGGFVGKNMGIIERSAFVGAVGIIIPPIIFILPFAGLLILLLIIGLILLLLRWNDSPYGPEIIDPNQKPIIEQGEVAPPPAGSNRISFELNQTVYINAATQVGIINYVNPNRSTQDVVISILVSDAELLRTIGKTGRSAAEQAALEAKPGYDPEKSYQELFRSGRLQIGYQLEATKLGALADGTYLPVGEYEMIVAIDAYDPKTNEKAVVNAQAPITVFIVESDE